MFFFGFRIAARRATARVRDSTSITALDYTILPQAAQLLYYCLSVDLEFRARRHIFFSSLLQGQGDVVAATAAAGDGVRNPWFKKSQTLLHPPKLEHALPRDHTAPQKLEE